MALGDGIVLSSLGVLKSLDMPCNIMRSYREVKRLSDSFAPLIEYLTDLRNIYLVSQFLSFLSLRTWYCDLGGMSQQ